MSANLWKLAGDSRESVRVSALYAMMSNTVFLVKNECRILQAQ
jgi:Tfp pilus assembly protein PilN